MIKYIRHVAAYALLGFCLQSAQAAEPIESMPGYLALDELPLIAGAQPSVEITLSGPVLKMLLQLPVQYGRDTEEAIEMLKVVEHILVRIFPLDDDRADDTLAFMQETSTVLEQQDWTRIVRVREEDDSNVDIHVKLSPDGENLNGLAIMAMDEGDNGEPEVVFVNIVGNFNPAYLANIGKQFDIEHLEGVEVP